MGLAQHLWQEFDKRVPHQSLLAAQATARALGAHEDDPEWIKAHFSEMLEAAEQDAYDRFLAAQGEARRAAFMQAFGRLLRQDATAMAALELVADHLAELDRFFMSLAQARKARAGKTFEHLIRALFSKLGYPFDRQPKINGTPDFVLPSTAYFRRNPIDCIILTVKRTLRERWRQIVTEGAGAPFYFLATIDRGINSRMLDEMKDKKVFVVVPDTLKNEKYDYQNALNVLSFEQFFRDHLDPAMRRWRENRVV